MSDELDVALALEALIFSTPDPISPGQIRNAFPRLTPSRIAELVKGINETLHRDGRPYEICEIAGGYQFRTRPEYGELIVSGQPQRHARLSRASLETLSIVAYRQPITRAEVEAVRCVDCGGVMKGLLERELIRIIGRRDAPGRPPLYGTSARFLEIFGLSNLAELPELREIATDEAAGGTPGISSVGEPDTDDGREEAEGSAQP